MNIVLIGYRCAGKTVVGQRLAERLQRRFVDTDDLLEERLGIPINHFVESYGWGQFRAMEKEIIEEISDQDHLVIAPGGGAVLEADNVTALRKKGLMIWLKADKEAIRKRMEGDSRTLARRPTLTGKGALEELEEVMACRQAIYEKAAEVEFDTSNLDIETVAERILTLFSQKERELRS